MDLSAIKAKIAAGVLPEANGIAVTLVRYRSGVCVGCDASVSATDIGVQFIIASRSQLLHLDCYAMWTEACPKQPRPLCAACEKPLEDGTPRYRLKGGLSSVHVECRDTVKADPRRTDSEGRAAAAS